MSHPWTVALTFVAGQNRPASTRFYTIQTMRPAGRSRSCWATKQSSSGRRNPDRPPLREQHTARRRALRCEISSRRSGSVWGSCLATGTCRNQHLRPYLTFNYVRDVTTLLTGAAPVQHSGRDEPLSDLNGMRKNVHGSARVWARSPPILGQQAFSLGGTAAPANSPRYP